MSHIIEDLINGVGFIGEDAILVGETSPWKALAGLRSSPNRVVIGGAVCIPPKISNYSNSS